MVALCPQLHEYSLSLVAELGLSFPILRDEDNRVSTAFGLTLPQPDDVIAAEQSLGLELPAHNGNDNWDLPIPARYVIDAEAQVLYRALHVDHRRSGAVHGVGDHVVVPGIRVQPMGFVFDFKLFHDPVHYRLIGTISSNQGILVG